MRAVIARSEATKQPVIASEAKQTVIVRTTVIASVIASEAKQTVIVRSTVIASVAKQPEPLTPSQVDTYLRLLGVPGSAPSRAALDELVRAHLMRVPFENVSKRYYVKTLGLTGLPGIDRFLEGIEASRFGGTCYANNFYFYLLLSGLGYDARLCGADMSSPDVHLVSMVSLDGKEFIVDGGYGAPFLRPMPRGEGMDQVIELGNERYVLRPEDSLDNSRMDLYRDGSLKHGYTAKPGPRRIEEFARVIAESFLPSATFMNALTVTRFEEGASVVLRNRTLIRSRGRECVRTTIDSREGVLEAVEMEFGIRAGIVSEILPEIGNLRDAWA